MPPATIIDWKKTVVNRKNALIHAYPPGLPPGRHFMSAGRRHCSVPGSRARDATVLPKPQGALNSAMRPQVMACGAPPTA